MIISKANKVGFFKELSYSIGDAINIWKAERRNIITPDYDPKISVEENYLRQFETRISLSGDIIFKLARYDAYETKTEWEQQLNLHRKKVEQYSNARFLLFEHIHTLIAGVLLGSSILLTAINIYREAKYAIELELERLNWFWISINLVLWLSSYLWKKYRKLVLSFLLKKTGEYLLKKLKLT